ncbi:hypothetical protein R1sor_001177 [Riccia sorocarpa]|uniref:diacylglycerol O-acyltransferase n=1 Tax=Riccia sorocarpa TaxID=122646 RepID=A0ABD3GYH0_9MARC
MSSPVNNRTSIALKVSGPDVSNNADTIQWLTEFLGTPEYNLLLAENKLDGEGLMLLVEDKRDLEAFGFNWCHRLKIFNHFRKLCSSSTTVTDDVQSEAPVRTTSTVVAPSNDSGVKQIPSYDEVFVTKQKGKSNLAEDWPEAHKALLRGHGMLRDWFRRPAVEYIELMEEIQRTNLRTKQDMRVKLSDFVEKHIDQLPPLVFHEELTERTMVLKWKPNTVYKQLLLMRYDNKKSTDRKRYKTEAEVVTEGRAEPHQKHSKSSSNSVLKKKKPSSELHDGGPRDTTVNTFKEHNQDKKQLVPGARISSVGGGIESDATLDVTESEFSYDGEGYWESLTKSYKKKNFGRKLVSKAMEKTVNATVPRESSAVAAERKSTNSATVTKENASNLPKQRTIFVTKQGTIAVAKHSKHSSMQSDASGEDDQTQGDDSEAQFLALLNERPSHSKCQPEDTDNEFITSLRNPAHGGNASKALPTASLQHSTPIYSKVQYAQGGIGVEDLQQSNKNMGSTFNQSFCGELLGGSQSAGSTPRGLRYINRSSTRMGGSSPKLEVRTKKSIPCHIEDGKTIVNDDNYDTEDYGHADDHGFADDRDCADDRDSADGCDQTDDRIQDTLKVHDSGTNSKFGDSQKRSKPNVQTTIVMTADGNCKEDVLGKAETTNLKASVIALAKPGKPVTRNGLKRKQCEEEEKGEEFCADIDVELRTSDKIQLDSYKITYKHLTFESLKIIGLTVLKCLTYNNIANRLNQYMAGENEKSSKPPFKNYLRKMRDEKITIIAIHAVKSHKVKFHGMAQELVSDVDLMYDCKGWPHIKKADKLQKQEFLIAIGLILKNNLSANSTPGLRHRKENQSFDNSTRATSLPQEVVSKIGDEKKFKEGSQTDVSVRYTIRPSCPAHKKIRDSPLSSDEIFSQVWRSLWAPDTRFWFSSESLKDWPLLMCGLSLSLIPLSALMVEKLTLNYRISDWVIFLFHAIIVNTAILYPNYIIQRFNSSLLSGFIFIIFSIVAWMKLMSYAHTNSDARTVFRKGEKV